MTSQCGDPKFDPRTVHLAFAVDRVTLAVFFFFFFIFTSSLLFLWQLSLQQISICIHLLSGDGIVRALGAAVPKD